MNRCFFLGKIKGEVEFKFILEGKNDSIAIFQIELRNATILKVITFNDLADYSYRKLQKEDIVCIEGKLDSKLNVIAIKLEKITNERIEGGKCSGREKYAKTKKQKDKQEEQIYEHVGTYGSDNRYHRNSSDACSK